MTSLDGLVRVLARAAEEVERAVQHVHGSAAEAGKVRDACDALGMRDLVERFTHLRENIVGLEARLAARVESARGLVAQVEAIAVGAPSSAIPPSASVRPAAAPAIPELTGTYLADVLGAMPGRVENKGPTSGQLFDEQNHVIADGALRSSRDTRVFDDLDLPRRARRSEAMASHVEAKAAALMRKGKTPRHWTLVINNAEGPCGWLARQLGEPRFGTSCDELLSDVLPAGSSLTVRWRDSAGVERSEVYRGTGRGIRR